MSTKLDTQVEDIIQGMSNLTKIKKQLFTPVVYQSPAPRKGFKRPNCVNIYKPTGGAPIGERLSTDFQPMDLNKFFESIVESITTCCPDLDLSKMKFTEYGGGRRISFDIPLEPRLINSGAKNDVIDSRLKFITGFDGTTANHLTIHTYRQWCENGCKAWMKDLKLSWRNTKGSLAKVAAFSHEVVNAIGQGEDYYIMLERLATKKVTKKQADQYIRKVFGYDLAEELVNKPAERLEHVWECVDKEFANSGSTAFSLLQGLTRYTTHELVTVGEDAQLFGQASRINREAHKQILVFN